VHDRCFGQADRATHEPLDPGPQIDGLAFDLLRLCFANCVLLGIDMALVGTPPIGIKSRDAKGFSKFFQLEKHCIFSPPKDIRSHLPALMIHRMPYPPRLRLLAHITPQLIEF